MKLKHLRIRIKQCLALSEASNCPRRKFGAVLIDPVRNVILMDGYNGGPRGGGDLCGGGHCTRDGVTEADVEILSLDDSVECDPAKTDPEKEMFFLSVHGEPFEHPTKKGQYCLSEAESLKGLLIQKCPPIPSGTHVEIGCVHAEMNVICNCAYNGVATKGAWLVVTGEPCLMCAKLIHHAGIVKVFAVGGGYMGRNGVAYLRHHGIEVQFVEGPQDPRLREGMEGADELG